MVRRLGPLFVALALALSLTGCGSSDNGGASGSAKVSTAANGDRFNDADVAFATGMIPHHAQALVMVDMTSGRRLSPELTALTDQIREAQAPEIETMTGWLTDWDQKVPETSRDHANAGHDMEGMDGMDGMDEEGMPGMMSAEEMHSLESASGPAFETTWLKLMIKHHEGAVAMARTEQADGHFKGAITLADGIVSSQRAEIEQMRTMLGG